MARRKRRKRKRIPLSPEELQRRRVVANRKSSKVYYARNKELVKAKNLPLWKARRDAYYQENQGYVKARVRLRSMCRPDRRKRSAWKKTYPDAPSDHVEYDAVTVSRLEIIYRQRLRELRTLYGRDPDTGRCR